MERAIAILDHNDPRRGIWIRRNPNSPHIENPNKFERRRLDAYWKGVIDNAEEVRQMQMQIPGWLPPLYKPMTPTEKRAISRQLTGSLKKANFETVMVLFLLIAGKAKNLK